MISAAVLQAQRDAIAKLSDAMKKDQAPVFYCRVPSGDCCAFCAMQAADGWMFSDESKADEGWHNDCQCIPVPAWDKDGYQIEGFDPEEYAAMRDDALEALAEDGIENPTDSEILAQMRKGGGVTDAAADPVAASPIFMSSNDPLFQNMQNVEPIGGYTDVAIHGNEDGFSYSDRSGAQVPVSVDEFTSRIQSSKDYDGGPVRLLSCSTGGYSDGAAQQLADKLGVNVMAPTDTLWVYPNGDTIISKNRDEAIKGITSGTWKVFKPR